MLTLEAAKQDLRVFHEADDELIQMHINAANAEALQFCGRIDWGGATPADVLQAQMLLVRAAYEGADPDVYRKAAEVKLCPHRQGWGI